MPPLRLSSKQCHRLCRRRRRRRTRLLPGNQRTGVSQAAALGSSGNVARRGPRASIAAARLRLRRQTVVVVLA